MSNIREKKHYENRKKNIKTIKLSPRAGAKKKVYELSIGAFSDIKMQI